MPTTPRKRPSARQLRAMAYALVDEAETRASAHMARNPAMTWRDALNRALADMGGA